MLHSLSRRSYTVIKLRGKKCLSPINYSADNSNEVAINTDVKA